MALRTLRRSHSIRERELSVRIGLSRTALRGVERRSSRARLATVCAVAAGLGRRVQAMATDPATSSAQSTVAVAYKIDRDGVDSWKLHVMDMVDEFRRTLDGRLIGLPPPTVITPRLRALLASVVLYLCREVDMDPPHWVTRSHFLAEPWFVADTESLKASALLEAPLEFRRNNIFVLDNFLSRV